MQQQDLRIGVFGGTFDPVHLGHLRAARSAVEVLRLDRLIWVPNRLSPLRQAENRTPGKHRLAMLERVVAEEPACEASDVEVVREGPSYLIDTLETLRAERSEAEWFFLMGMDSVETFDRWVRVEDIVALAQVWVMPRPGRDAEGLLQALETRAPFLKGKVRLLEGPNHDISATEIRRRVRAGETLTDLVPDSVADYIRDHELYR